GSTTGTGPESGAGAAAGASGRDCEVSPAGLSRPGRPSVSAPPGSWTAVPSPGGGGGGGGGVSGSVSPGGRRTGAGSPSPICGAILTGGSVEGVAGWVPPLVGDRLGSWSQALRQ